MSNIIGDTRTSIRETVVRPTRPTPSPAPTPSPTPATPRKKATPVAKKTLDAKSAEQTLLGSIHVKAQTATPVGASAKAETGSRWSGVSNFLKKSPLGLQGRASELLGSGLRTSGEGLGIITRTLDEKSSQVPTREVRTGLGIVSGTLGFVGSAFEGLGGAAELTGRLTQGDEETVRSTVDKARGLGEASSYVLGSAHVAAGHGLESLGQRTGFKPLELAGEHAESMGRDQQALAGEGTRAVVDQLADTTVHYGARLNSIQQRAEGRLADAVGLDGAAGYLNGKTEDSSRLAEEKRTPLSDALHQAVRDRREEYRTNGDYAISRDATRAAWEIGTLVFSPEAALSTVDKGAEVASGVNKVTEVTATVDRVTDAERALDKVSEAGRALHGDRFSQVGSPWQTFPNGASSRSVLDAQDGSFWHEVVTGDGSHLLHRPAADGGEEVIRGANRFISRDQLAAEEAAAGTHRVLQVGDRQVLVQGKATPEQIAHLQGALDRLPAGAQQHLPQDILLNDNLGSILDLKSGDVLGPIEGLGGNGSILVRPSHLENAEQALGLVGHELGHELDNALGGISNGRRWQPGSRGISPYAGVNAAENLAEHSRVVLQEWEKFSGKGVLGWLGQPDRLKFAQLVDQYGGSVPRLFKPFF